MIAAETERRRIAKTWKDWARQSFGFTIPSRKGRLLKPPRHRGENRDAGTSAR